MAAVRRRWVLVLAAAVAAVVALVTVPLLLTTPGDAGSSADDAARKSAVAAEDAVRAYFAALTARDAVAAQALLAPGFGADGEISLVTAPLTPHADTSLLTDRTLDDPGYQPPKSVEVELERLQGEEAMVTARGLLPGGTFDNSQSMTVTLNLIRHASPGEPPRWRLLNGLRELPLRGTGAKRLLVAGTTVAVDDFRPPQYAAFPGSYHTVMPDHPLIEGRPMTSFTDGGGTTMSVRVRPHVQEAVEREVRRFLDRCARNTGPVPVSECGYAGYTQWDGVRVSRKIVRYPEVILSVNSDGSLSVNSGLGEVELKSSAGSQIMRVAAHGTARLVAGKIQYLPG